MGRKRIYALIITVVMLFTTLLSGCGQSSSPAGGGSTNAASQIVNVAITADPKSFDSSKINESAANTIVLESMEGLVRLDSKHKLQPAGAASWDSSEDGLVWTFHLRDYNWSDGKKVTAQNFEYAIKRMFDPEVACPNAAIFYCIKGGQEYNTGKGTADGVGAKALDDKTLQITLSKKVPYFLQLTNFISLFPLRKDIVDKSGESYGSDPKAMVFNGPFVVDQWVKGSKIVLKKNTAYWDAANVKLDQANVNIVPEQATREQLFTSKQLDLIQDVKGEFAAKLKDSEAKGDVTSIIGYYPTTMYIAFNNQDKNNFFTNAKIRLAFSIAIDREGYTKNVVKKDIPAYGFVPFGLNNGDKVFREAVEEPLKAVMNQDPKQLYQEGLKELGLDPSKEYEVTFLQSNANADTRVIGEYYQNQWQTKLGVKVKIDVASDSATFNTQVQKGEYQICQTGWGADYDDPMTFMEMFLTIQGSDAGNNSIFFSDPEYDRLVKAAASETDMAKRLDMFKQAEKILVVDKAGLAPISFQLKSNYMQSYLKGVYVQAGGPAFELKTAYLEKK